MGFSMGNTFKRKSVTLVSLGEISYIYLSIHPSIHLNNYMVDLNNTLNTL